jgi:uncharacterized protein YneF (UPF0154 family)
MARVVLINILIYICLLIFLVLFLFIVKKNLSSYSDLMIYDTW